MSPALPIPILSSELPLDGLLCGVAGELPLLHFMPQGLPIGQATIQALAVEDADSISAMFNQLLIGRVVERYAPQRLVGSAATP